MTHDQHDEPQIWLGLATVHQRAGAGVLLDRNDAFVNVVVVADSIDEFTKRIREALSQLGFELTDLEEVETLTERRAAFKIPQEIESLADVARDTGTVQFGSFYTWTSDDDAP